MNRYRVVRCLSRTEITEDSKLIYRWRVGNQSCYDSYLEWHVHRVPFFLSISAHVTIEWILGSLGRCLIPRLFENLFFLFYDVVYGVVCAHGMKEILTFWKLRRE